MGLLISLSRRSATTCPSCSATRSRAWLWSSRGDDGDAQRGVRASCCREQRRGALVVCITHQKRNRCFPSHVLCSRTPEQRQRQAGQGRGSEEAHRRGRREAGKMQGCRKKWPACVLFNKTRVLQSTAKKWPACVTQVLPCSAASLPGAGAARECDRTTCGRESSDIFVELNEARVALGCVGDVMERFG